MKKDDYICPVNDCSECKAKHCWQDHVFCDQCEDEIIGDVSKVELEYRASNGKWVKESRIVCDKCYMEMEKPQTISHRQSGANQLNKSIVKSQMDLNAANILK